MEITTLCTVIAVLGVFPNRSQFFQYESVSFSLNCEQQGDAAGWIVKRNTSRQINQDCPSSWDSKNKSYCFFDVIYEADSGVYWCESEAGDCINTVNITVTAGSLILELPALPVTEGEAVTLRCTTWTTSAETLISEFYKDELLIGVSSTGNVTLHSVSKPDEGLYWCNVPGVGESPQSWLSVKARLPVFSSRVFWPLAPTHVILPVASAVLSLILLLLLCLTGNHEDDLNSTVVFYTGNTCKQKYRRKGGLQTRHTPLLSSVVLYRPVLTSPQLWVYKPSRRRTQETGCCRTLTLSAKVNNLDLNC